MPGDRSCAGRNAGSKHFELNKIFILHYLFNVGVIMDKAIFL